MYRASLLYIHYGILVTLFLSIANQTLWFYYYRTMNDSGRWTLTFLGFIVLIQIITQIARMVLMLTLSLGLGTNVSLLKNARVVDYDLMNLDELDNSADTEEPHPAASVNSSRASSTGILCWKTPAPPTCNKMLVCRLVLFCILTFVFHYVDAMISTARVYTPAFLLTKSKTIFISMSTILITLVFYLWVVINLTNTFRFLKGHPIQLRDYKLFLAALITAFLLSVGTMGYKVYSKLVEGSLTTSVEDWNAVWENGLLWSLVTAFLLFSVAAIWNPHRSSSFSRSTHVA